MNSARVLQRTHAQSSSIDQKLDVLYIQATHFQYLQVISTSCCMQTDYRANVKFFGHEKILFLELTNVNIIATALLRVIHVQTSSTKGSISPRTKSNNNWSKEMLSGGAYFSTGYSTNLWWLTRISMSVSQITTFRWDGSHPQWYLIRGIDPCRLCMTSAVAN